MFTFGAGEPASGDFDKEGLTNLIEYALGLNPTASSQSPGTFASGVINFTKGADALTNNDVVFEIGIHRPRGRRSVGHGGD